MRKLVAALSCPRSYLLFSNGLGLQHQSTVLRTSSSCFLGSHYYSSSPSSSLLKTNSMIKGLNSGKHRLNGWNSYLLKTPCLTWSACRAYAKKGKDKGGKPHKKVVLTDDELEGLVDMEKVKLEFSHVVDDLKDKFIHQLTVRTSQGVFDNLIVKTPDGNFPLIQLGQVVQKSPQLLTINMAPSPQYITHVKEALAGSGLNINPQQDGTSLFVPLPKVTREHRENLVKNAKMLSEKSKKQLRDIYSKYSRKIKSSKEGHSADDLIAADDMIKELMHGVMHSVEEMTTAKQQELLGGK